MSNTTNKIIYKQQFGVIPSEHTNGSINDNYICYCHDDFKTGHFDLLVLHIRGIKRPSYNPPGKKPQPQLKMLNVLIARSYINIINIISLINNIY